MNLSSSKLLQQVRAMKARGASAREIKRSLGARYGTGKVTKAIQAACECDPLVQRISAEREDELVRDVLRGIAAFHKLTNPVIDSRY